MKKTIFTICMALMVVCVSLGTYAQTSGASDIVTVVRINKTDGSTVRFRLPTKPEIRFADDKMVVNAQEIEPLELPRNEVSHIDFEKTDISVGIADLKADDFIFSYVGESVQLASPSLRSASIFDLAGHKLAAKTSVDGMITFDVSDLQPGVYIVAPDCHPAIRIIRK